MFNMLLVRERSA